MLSLLILVTKDSCNACRKMFGDEVDCQSWESSQVTTADGSKESGRDGTAQGGMMIQSKVMFGFISPEDPICLMGGWRDRYGPQAIGHSTSSNDYTVILDDLDMVLGEKGSAIIIAELGK